MRLSKIYFSGSLKKRFIAHNEPIHNTSQPIFCAADLQVRERNTIRLLAYSRVIAILSCMPLALCGCGGNALVGTSAQAGSLSASPSLAAFGSVPVGQNASSRISVTNSGQTAMQVTQVSVTGQTFSVSGLGDLPATIGAGSTYQFDVIFSPQALGAAAGQLTIASNASSKAMVIGLNGVGISGPPLSANSNSISFGSIALNTVATQPITLSNGSTPVSITAATVVGSGFSLPGGTLPISLSPGQAATLNVQFAPTVAGPATGTLTITSTSATAPTTVVSLSGTGISSGTGTTGGSYQVDLSWEAPSSSQDPVAGYNVYRSPSGASSYQELNSSIVTGTTYTDSTAQAGQSYDYVVESADISGVESSPSNTAHAALP